MEEDSIIGAPFGAQFLIRAECAYSELCVSAFNLIIKLAVQLLDSRRFRVAKVSVQYYAMRKSARNFTHTILD